MTQITTVKENSHDSMVRFGLKLAWFNLLGMVILVMVLFSLREETAEWAETTVGVLGFINIALNVLIFCFALVGIFKSTLRWSAFLAMCISIVIFIIYLLAAAACLSGN
ncbi:hypothetical protein [Serratia fonticola]|uniref:hypothetical protein n=1 Tax=Serratia fonticola TaxID=47917 RepID=UPI0034C6809C